MSVTYPPPGSLVRTYLGAVGVVCVGLAVVLPFVFAPVDVVLSIVAVITTVGAFTYGTGRWLRRSVESFVEAMPDDLDPELSSGNRGNLSVEWPTLAVSVSAGIGPRYVSALRVRAGEASFPVRRRRAASGAREALARAGRVSDATGEWDGEVPRAIDRELATGAVLVGLVLGVGAAVAGPLVLFPVALVLGAAVAGGVVAWSHRTARSAVADLVREWDDAGVEITDVSPAWGGLSPRWVVYAPSRAVGVRATGLGSTRVWVATDGEEREIDLDALSEEADATTDLFGSEGGEADQQDPPVAES